MDNDIKPPVETLYLYDVRGGLIRHGPPDEVMKLWFDRGANDADKIEPARRREPGPAPVDIPFEATQVAPQVAAVSTGRLSATVPTKTRPPVVQVVPVPARPVMAPVRAGTVSEVAAERVARHENLLLSMGIALPPPVYAPGTRVRSDGDAKFSTLRRAWGDMPLTVDALEETRDMIRGESRRDTDPTPARDLYMDDQGWLHLNVNTKSALPLEENGLRGLLTHLNDVFPRATPTLLMAKPATRARFFNEHLQENRHLLVNEDGSPKLLRLRTRKFGAVRSIFATVTPSYGVRNADVVCDDVIAGLATAPWLQDARGEVVYDPETSRLRVDALRFADKIVDLAAGDVFKGGARIQTDDGGGSGINVYGIFWRNRCLNLQIIGTGKVRVVARRHRGVMDGVTEDVAEGLTQVDGMVDGLAADWGLLRATPINTVTLWGEKFKDVPSALAWAVKDGRISVDIRRDVLAEVLLSGWKEEPGNTLADLENAITRAHTSEMIDQWQREQIERAAGELVPVLVRAAA